MITPPATIGMLGGGQLGRYAVVAARLMGYRTMVLDPDAGAPAGRVADEHLVAPYDDADALHRLAATCSVVTTEFENPPAHALQRLAAGGTTVAPPASAVAVAQDRIAEKSFLAAVGAPVAPWAPLVSVDDLDAASRIGAPAIVKTARLGYDGKGQAAVADPADLPVAWDTLGCVPCVVERRIPLDVEVSVLVARRANGETVVYPLAENQHRDGILDLTVVPARVSADAAAAATALAADIASALEYVGVLAVEMFVSDGQLLVNELAPRPHNSGHWTLDACATSQFAQQIRAVTGTALGPATMTSPAAAMVNLLGDLWPAGGQPNWHDVLLAPEATLHLYGKAAARPGRKMGHITVRGADADSAAELAVRLRRSTVDP
jgi:5-(carboxyamino)imidazole ribonucleotide synthase